MLEILTHLEHLQEPPKTIIFNELDEVNSVIFFMHGQCDIGFEINRKQEYVLRLDKSIIIGAYNLTFNTRSNFVYRTHSHCRGYFIRRSNWKAILDDEEHKILAQLFKKRVKQEYQEKIVEIMKPKKLQWIHKWMQRADYQASLRVISNTCKEP